MAKLLRIPIKRFDPLKPIKENLLLELPKNQKRIRLVHSGDPIQGETLDRLRAKGVPYLCFLVEDNDNRDPLTCEIYQNLANDNSNAAKTLDPKNQLVQETIESKILDNGTTDEEQKPRLEAESLPLVREEEKTNDALLAEEPLEKQDLGPDNTESRFSAEVTAPLEEQRFSKTTEEVDTFEQNFQADPKEKEQELRFSNTDKKSEEEMRFQSSGKQKLEEIRIKQSSTKKEEEEEFRFQSKPENENEQEFKVTSKPTSSSDSDASKTKVKNLQQLKDSILEGIDIDFAGSKIDLLNDAKSQILGTKIEKSLFELILGSTPENENETKAAVRNLEMKLKKVSSGRIEEEENKDIESTEEFLEFQSNLEQNPIPISEVMVSVQKIEQSRKISSEKLVSAYEFEKNKLTRTNTPAKDAPLTLSKLAAYLGSAIGYSNIDFLAELGLGAVIQYKERQGEEIKKDQIPSFTKRALWENSPPNSLIDDYQHIMKFLEFYSSDPMVDLKEKEFSKKIFERTLERAKNSNFSPDPLNLSQWIQFVEQGPSMDIHSNCSKASAKALKQAKDFEIL